MTLITYNSTCDYEPNENTRHSTLKRRDCQYHFFLQKLYDYGLGYLQNYFSEDDFTETTWVEVVYSRESSNYKVYICEEIDLGVVVRSPYTLY